MTIVTIVSYPKHLQKIHSDIPFLPERMMIEKCQNLLINMYDNENYVVRIKALI